MKLNIRYLVQRPNKDGTSRFYWDRPGFELEKLGKDAAQAASAADRLNKEAEGRKPDPLAAQYGSVNWVIDEYRETDHFNGLSAGSQRVYGNWFKRIGRVMGDVPITAVQRSSVRALLKTVPGPSQKTVCGAVLSHIFETARDLDLIKVNLALKLGIKKGDGRAEWFPPEDVKAWMAAAAERPLGPIMITKFWLLYYAGQRVVDTLTMPGECYNGDTILLRQQKTHKLMRVPTHRRLRAHLDALGLTPGEPIGGAIEYHTFRKAWREICAAAGLTVKQARDLRRTAVIMLAEAGCTDIQISAITGHSLTSIKAILETNYLVRTDSMARDAIRKWEENDDAEDGKS